MTAAELRRYWEERIPAIHELVSVTDAHRLINRGRHRELISRSTLQRRAAAGLASMGGPDTEFRSYRIMRRDLLKFLEQLDPLAEPAPAPQPAPRQHATPRLALEPASVRTPSRRRPRQMHPDQITLLLPEA